MATAAEKLRGEVGAEVKSLPKRQPRAAGDFDLFGIANAAEPLRVLDRLGIAHHETSRGVMAVCPGCGEDGALLCKDGGLKCLHDRCAAAGPRGNPGYRTNVDLVAHVKQLEPADAAKLICEWSGIEVPRQKAKPLPEPPPGMFDDDVLEEVEPGAPAPKAPSVFASNWITLGERPELLTDEPPKQRWLLTRHHKGREIGVLPRGKTGALVGAGGVSKTMVAIQLSVAAATGGTWLETFRFQEPVHVLLALAEEDLDEFRRRFWRACNALELSLDERSAMAPRIHILPLHGQSVALLASPTPGLLVPSQAAIDLRTELEQRGIDWGLIVLDPLSRWASGGVEGDNEAATRFCQVVETLASVRGNPTVLVVHHSSQNSVRSGSSDARGVTGIRDGFRWMASLDAGEGEAGERSIRLRNKKSNYSLEFEELTLVRSQEPGCEGTLRLATPAEQERLAAPATPAGRPAVSHDDMAERLLATLRKLGRARIKRDLIEATEGDDNKLYKALSSLLAAGTVARDAEGWMVAAETLTANEATAS